MDKVKQYQTISLQNKLAKASNYEVVQMLFEAAMQKMAAAEYAIKNENTAFKVTLINEAIAIIENLNANLNYEAGELAQNFHNLYQFILANLVLANTKNSLPNLKNAFEVLQKIKEGWDGIKAKV